MLAYPEIPDITAHVSTTDKFAVLIHYITDHLLLRF